MIIFASCFTTCLVSRQNMIQMKKSKISFLGIGPFFRLLGIAMVIGLALCTHVLNASVIQHNIGNGNLIISGNSTDDYVITGSTSSYYIEVQLGYHGTITLQNCSFNFSGYYNIHSPIRIVGKDGQTNDNPLTIVNLVLEGNNVIQNNGGGRACIQVDQGTQVNISAIDPCDNNSGVLIAKQLNSDGGAAIGSLNRWLNSNEPTATSRLYNQNGSQTGSGMTAGGNVVISSGTVTARGGHGAGIGGGFQSYYDGMIVIYGGVVEATSDFDAAGVGSGCPEGTGVIQVYASHSAVIALPPAQITAKGAGATPNGGVGHTLFSELGLAGTKVRVYIGDPNMTDCPIQVYTEDRIPDANVYVDLSQDPDINRVVTAMVDPALLDINQVFFGTTNASGIYSTTGKLRNNTTFFTDAVSISPDTYGHPYLPKVAALPTGGTVQLERLKADFRIESFPSTPLLLGYSSEEAQENATCVKLVYNDVEPISEVRFDLANGSATDFDHLIFLASDSTTVIPAPTTLSQGDIYYIIVPLKTGKSAYSFSDVLRIIGIWHGSSTSYIRQIVTQVVGDLHTEHICAGGSYWFNGEALTESGIYTNVTTTTSQCQALSIVEVLNLVVDPPMTSSFEDTGCDEYVWNGMVYTTSGQYEQHFQTQFGCDSLVTLHLTVEHIETHIQENGCDAYEWYGTTYTASGQYQHLLQTQVGCDSLVVMDLDMHTTETTHETSVSCDQFEWRGEVYTESGTYEHLEGQTIHGCDSICYLDLTINRTPQVEILGYSQVAYSSSQWPGIYHYYVMDSTQLEPGSITWSFTNPDWIFVPVSDFHCMIIAKSEGEAVLSLETNTTVGCNTSASLEINATAFGVDEEEGADILLFPNPAQTEVTVSAPEMSHVILRNALGQIVLDVPVERTDKATIGIENLSQGLYLVEITTVFGKTAKRLVISR